MKTHLFASIAACLLTTSACRDVGSCLYPAAGGFAYCEDFLGNEYNQSVTQNTCSEGSGAWSAKPCSSAGALGTCTVPITAGQAQNVLYTYYARGDATTPPATALTVETACGVSGGSFTAQ